MIKGFHHVGYLVDDMDKVIALYQKLFGAEVEYRKRVEERGTDHAFIRVGPALVELSQPLDKSHLEGRQGPVLDHVAYGVDDATAALETAKAQGVELLDEKPRPNDRGWKVANIRVGKGQGTRIQLVEL